VAVGGAASLEDSRAEGGRFAREQAVERVHAAAEAARGLHFPFALTARAENHIRGNPRLEDTIERLQAFQAVGADVLYAPGLRNVAEIRAVCEAVSKPVNVLAVPHLTVPEITAAGAQRISVGGALTWVAAKAVAEVATAIRDSGDLSALAARPPLERWFG
jgi:2-methylisocitrate lyase-like PEP mutase family enzyme